MDVIDDAVTVLRVILDYIGIDADDMVTIFSQFNFTGPTARNTFKFNVDVPSMEGVKIKSSKSKVGQDSQ